MDSARWPVPSSSTAGWKSGTPARIPLNFAGNKFECGKTADFLSQLCRQKQSVTPEAFLREFATEKARAFTGTSETFEEKERDGRGNRDQIEGSVLPVCPANRHGQMDVEPSQQKKSRQTVSGVRKRERCERIDYRSIRRRQDSGHLLKPNYFLHEKRSDDPKLPRLQTSLYPLVEAKHAIRLWFC